MGLELGLSIAVMALADEGGKKEFIRSLGLDPEGSQELDPEQWKVGADKMRQLHSLFSRK